MAPASGNAASCLLAPGPWHRWRLPAGDVAADGGFVGAAAAALALVLALAALRLPQGR